MGKRLFVTLRGQLVVAAAGGNEIIISSARSRALLIYLALTPGCRVGRKELANQLWEIAGKGSARANLRQELSVLRSLLDRHAPGAIDGNHEAIWLDRSVVWIDILEEADCIADTATALPGWITRRRTLLDGAIELETEFDEWLGEQRTNYDLRTLDALDRRAQELHRTDLPADYKIAEFRALTDCAPADETYCQSLIELLAEHGTSTEVNRVYRRCKDANAGAGEPQLDAETNEVYNNAIARIRVRNAAVQLQGQLVPANSAPILLTASAAAPAFSLAPSIQALFIGVRPLVDLMGDSTLDRLTALLNTNIFTDLPLMVQPFSIVELPVQGVPSADEALCGCIVSLSLEIERKRGDAYVCVNIHYLCRSTRVVRKSNRATALLSSVLDDRRRLSNRVAAKIHLDLIIEYNRMLASEVDETLSANQMVVRGIALLRSRNTRDNMARARRYFGGALAKDSSNIDAMTGLAHVLHRLASQPAFDTTPRMSLLQGRQLIDDVLERDPNHIWGNFVSGLLSSSLGRPEQTLVVFDRILGMTAHPQAMTCRGYNKVIVGSPRSGLDDIQRSLGGLQDDPSLPIWYFFQGVAHYHCGETNSAIESFGRSIQIDPGYGTARIWLAGCQQINGGKREAATEISAFKSACPTYTLADFDDNWGAARGSNRDYLSRTEVVARALDELQVPQGR